MKRMPWRKTDRREARFLFLDEFEYDAIPGRKALQLFDIDNATLYIFVYRGNCRKEELLDGRLLIRSQEPEFLKTCQLIAGRMGVTFPPKTDPARMLVWSGKQEERWQRNGSLLSRS